MYISYESLSFARLASSPSSQQTLSASRNKTNPVSIRSKHSFFIFPKVCQYRNVSHGYALNWDLNMSFSLCSSEHRSMRKRHVGVANSHRCDEARSHSGTNSLSSHLNRQFLHYFLTVIATLFFS